jgi:hypothetical protein
MQQILGLCFVFAMLGAALLLLRKKGALLAMVRAGSEPNGVDLRIRKRVPLTPHHCMHVVAFGGRELLLVTHPAGCTVINEQESNAA